MLDLLDVNAASSVWKFWFAAPPGRLVRFVQLKRQNVQLDLTRTADF